MVSITVLTPADGINPFTEAPRDFFPIGFTPFDKAVMDYSGAVVQEVHPKKRVKT
jgi:hypothetical protein